MVPSAFVFFMVMGLIMLGVATPTEALRPACRALLLAAYYGGLSWRMLTEARRR
jgi:TRAP-type mannitol/chloroaromatic compound transport system permease large subunit